MPDSLPDRIAAVIRREVPCHPPAADRIAREVIRELGMTPIDQHHNAATTRYVTGWINSV